MSLAFAIGVAAAAFDVHLWGAAGYVPPAARHLMRVVLLLFAVLVLVVLLWTVLRRDDRHLWLDTAHGGVLVPLGALERMARLAAGSNPDVVRVDVSLRERNGTAGGRVTVFARPLADEARLHDEVGEVVRGALYEVLGRHTEALEVRTNVLRVGQLKRYLA